MGCSCGSAKDGKVSGCKNNGACGTGAAESPSAATDSRVQTVRGNSAAEPDSASSSAERRRDSDVMGAPGAIIRARRLALPCPVAASPLLYRPNVDP